MDYISLALIISSVLITSIAQIYVSSTFSKYKALNIKGGLTGFEVARKILDNNNLKSVYITEVNGSLTDHYDPKRRVVRLSKEVYSGKSVSAISVAAHECGHALQDKDGYSFLKFRSILVPFVNFSSKFGYIAIIIGLLFGWLDLAWFGIILLFVILFFQLITLPVEFNASKRAVGQLETLVVVNGEEKKYARKVLNSAAFTYVAGLASTLLQILRLVLIVSSRRD